MVSEKDAIFASFQKVKIMRLSVKQRYTIFHFLQQKTSVAAIAQAIGVAKSTIYNEIKKNRDPSTLAYDPDEAQAKYEKRLREKRKFVRFDDGMKALVREKLSEDWSPEQIRGWCRANGIDMVSVEWIYRYIWEDKYAGGDLHRHLRRRCRAHRKRACRNGYRGIIPNRRDIGERPAEAERRQRFGDIEGDTVIGRHGTGVDVTLCDRATGLLWHRIVRSANAEDVTRAVISMLKPFKGLLHTITFDNGREFCRHDQIAKALKVDIFFAKPYHSWERGSNENLNGLIRQYYKKGSSFAWITPAVSDRVQSLLNNRPRKRFGFFSPIQEFLHIFANQNVTHLLHYLSRLLLEFSPIGWGGRNVKISARKRMKSALDNG